MLDVLELGAGFSTMVFGKSKSVRQLVSFEHDVAWAQFLAATLGLGPFIGRKGLALLGRFDVIFVDHGPEMSTRVDDLPWIVSRLTDDGLLLLDDWETRFVEDGPIYGGFTEASWRRLRELGDWGITVGGKCHHEAVLAARRK
jgi:predicted O-methyltransferase YrrM